jgi:hypothetical protein
VSILTLAFIILNSPQPAMASDNCALGPDGKLLDASKIPWFNDPDDDEPMASATTSSTNQRQVTTTLDSFITKAPPAARRSTRAPRPSTKAIDPNNIMNHKRKPSDTATGKPCRPRHTSPVREEDDATEPNPTDTEDEDPVDPDIAYEETRALGDADREVSLHYFSRGIVI